MGKVSGVDGLKTGYHNAAGSNIIITAKRGSKRVIVVILGSQKAANRNTIGEDEINNYFNGNSKTLEKVSVKTQSIQIKVIDKNDLIGAITINGVKYGLYSVDDVISKDENKTGLTYSLSLKDKIDRRDLGKVVGTFIATGDNKKEYTGALVLREMPK